MKKAVLYISIIAGFVLLGLWGGYKLANRPAGTVIHVTEDTPPEQISKLTSALKTEGKNVVLAVGSQSISGKFNIYTAKDIHHLPAVIDSDAINFLWVDMLKPDEKPEVLRPFDVIVVKNMPAYSHLKAINVRTAFIPEAIDIADSESILSTERAMFWGDGKEFSLSLMLAGKEPISLDVFGADFEGKWPHEEIKGIEPSAEDLRSHPLVLADQREEEIELQSINYRIIKIIENGGVPYVRYNPAIEKLFGEAVPMYYNELEFKEKLERLLQNPSEIEERRKAIKHIAKHWNCQSQARKFIELFEIMDKKRR